MTMTEILAACVLATVLLLMEFDHNQSVLNESRETVKYIQENQKIHDNQINEVTKQFQTINN